MSKVIRHELSLQSSAAKVYAALTDAKQFSAMSGGAPCEMQADEGATFSCFGGMIIGRFVELIPSQRIVQAWRVKMWPEGVYSLVNFDISAGGAGTKLVLEHSAYPEEQGEHLSEGWKTNYLEPIKKYLEMR